MAPMVAAILGVLIMENDMVACCREKTRTVGVETRGHTKAEGQEMRGRPSDYSEMQPRHERIKVKIVHMREEQMCKLQTTSALLRSIPVAGVLSRVASPAREQGLRRAAPEGLPVSRFLVPAARRRRLVPNLLQIFQKHGGRLVVLGLCARRNSHHGLCLLAAAHC